jgi:hypothetical protein
VSIESENVTFRDEDFDDHLELRVGPARHRAADERLGTYYRARQGEDPRAAVEVAEHLHRAGRHDELIDLALNDGQPQVLTEPLLRLATYRRRLELALDIALEYARHGDALGALLLAADAATSSDAITEMISQRPELAMRYGDVEQVMRIYLRGETVAWNGPLHLRAATAFARNGSLEEAREQLALADAWLRRWALEEPQGWSVEAEDVAAGVEATYLANGNAEAFAWLRAWRPVRFVLSVVDIVARDLAARCDADRLLADLEALPVPARIAARFHAALWSAGKRPSPASSLAVAERVLRGSPSSIDGGWGVGLAELLAKQGADRRIVADVALKFGPRSPDYLPHWSDRDGLAIPVRAAVLLAALDDTTVDAAALLPQRLRTAGDERVTHDVAEDRRRYLSAVEALLPVYSARARALVGEGSVPKMRAAIEVRLESARLRANRRFSEIDTGFRQIALAAVDGIMHLPGDGRRLLGEISSAANDALGDGAVFFALDTAAILARHARYKNEAISLLAVTLERLNAIELSASERSDALVRGSSIADAIDSSLAAQYYDNAVQVAEGVNDERVRLLQSVARLLVLPAPAMDTDWRATQAERLARAVERFEPHVSNRDYLPYGEVVAAVTALAPSAGLALVARWQDEGRLGLARGVPPLVRAATSANFLEPREAIWLLRLAGERFGPVTDSIPALDRLVARGASYRPELAQAISELALWVRRDVPVEARLRESEALLAWVEQQSLAHVNGISELRDLRDYARDAIDGQERAIVSVEFTASDDEAAPNLPIGTSEDALADLNCNFDDLALRRSNTDLETYLNNLAVGREGSDRVAFLQGLAELPIASRTAVLRASLVARIFVRYLNRWRNTPEVEAWRETGLREFVDRYLDALIGSDYYDEDEQAMSEFSAIDGIDRPMSLIMSSVAGRLSELSSYKLFRVAESFAAEVSHHEIAAVVDRLLANLEPEQVLPPELPSERSEALALFLFACFADMDKRVRWRAAHIAEAIATDDLITDLMSCFERRNGGAFRSRELHFYWISAQMWLSLLLARVAHDRPGLVRSHATRLAEIALDSSFPHVLIRDLAGRAALSASPAGDSTLSEDVRSRLAGLNMAASCFSQRGYRRSAPAGHWADPETRFQFNSVDTMPYWFDPAGALFGLSGLEVASLADEWIAGTLGIGDDDVWNDRRELRNERRWGELSNDHGTIPVLESLRTYLEYHAMHLAVGQLIDGGNPISVERYDDASDPINAWLSRHVELQPGRWLSDSRRPPPLEPFVYHDLGPIDRWRNRAETDFVNELGFRAREGWFVVAASMSVWGQDRHGSTDVMSALVEPDTAASLARSLSTRDYPGLHALPWESRDADWPDEREIEDGEFVLTGWLSDVRDEQESIERHDPLRRITTAGATPGRGFRAALSVDTDSTGLHLCSSSVGVVCELHAWNDDVGDQREYRVGRYSEGWRTWVSTAALLAYMAERELDLIVSVLLRRHIHRRRGEDSDYDRGLERTYVLRRDGSLDGLGSSYSLGTHH